MNDQTTEFEIQRTPLPVTQPLRLTSANTQWTAERDDILRAGVLAGKSRALIALELGTGRNAVIGRAHRLGITGKVVPRAPQPRREPHREPHRGRAGLTVAKVKRVRKWSEMAPEAAPEPIPESKVDIWGLTDKTCRWPLHSGDEPISEKFYCGAVLADGLPYCNHHCRKAFEPAHRAYE